MLAFILPAGFEWLIILVVALLLFGNRIPGMARSMGSAITEFKKGLKDGKDDGSGSKPPSLPGPTPGETRSS